MICHAIYNYVSVVTCIFDVALFRNSDVRLEAT
jgi:hypothetical protein